MEITVKASPITNLLKGHMFSHQACFIRTELLKVEMFDLNYKIVADFNQIVSLYSKQKKFLYLPFPITKILVGGISYINVRTYYERIKVIHSVKPYSYFLIYSIFLMLTAIVKKALSGKIVSRLRKIKWQVAIKGN